jgi:hypothetical protein
VPGSLRGVQVVIQHPLSCRVLVGAGVMVAGLRSGIGAEQVVEGEPARDVLGDEVGVGQAGQHQPCVCERDGGQAGGCGRGDAGPGVQAEQPEQPRRRVAELPAGPGEHGCDSVQCLQASLRIAQLLGQGRQREVRVGGGPGGHDAQCQR